MSGRHPGRLNGLIIKNTAGTMSSSSSHMQQDSLLSTWRAVVVSWLLLDNQRGTTSSKLRPAPEAHFIRLHAAVIN